MGRDLTKEMILSLDAMGGDAAPDVVIEGAEIALLRHPKIKFLLHGDEALLNPLLERHPSVAAASQVVHAEASVSMEDKISEAVRRGRNTSMWRAIDSVRQDEARAVISAGNTGALMAMGKIQLKTMPGISRPAIAALWPTIKGETVVLDLGANLETDEKQLVDFAIMGEAFARVELGIRHPAVGLLNIGEEELKGHDEIRGAAQLLRTSVTDMNFIGFVEGSDIGLGEVDVVVTDGFTGNIALKTAEGTARQFAVMLSTAMRRTWISKLGGLLASSAFRALKQKMDPNQSNGGVLLGLNGLVIKSHGGTDKSGFASAIDVAIHMAESEYSDIIRRRLASLEKARNGSDVANDGDDKRSSAAAAATNAV
jgi:glycerol-3-phosphate acyltransferase PlsX